MHFSRRYWYRFSSAHLVPMLDFNLLSLKQENSHVRSISAIKKKKSLHDAKLKLRQSLDDCVLSSFSSVTQSNKSPCVRLHTQTRLCEIAQIRTGPTLTMHSSAMTQQNRCLKQMVTVATRCKTVNTKLKIFRQSNKTWRKKKTRWKQKVRHFRTSQIQFHPGSSSQNKNTDSNWCLNEYPGGWGHLASDSRATNINEK